MIIGDEAAYQAEAARRLEYALDLLKRPYGWIKGTYSGVRTVHRKGQPRKIQAYCSLGAQRQSLAALDLPALTPQQRDRLDRIMSKAMVECIPPGAKSTVVRFNDDPETKKAQVLGMFKCAIGKVRP